MNIKHTKALSTAIAVAGLATAAPVFAQDAPPQATAPTAQATFAQLDADSDGAISKGEAAASAGLSASFAGLDADGNGSLNSAEFAKFEAMQGTSNDAGDMDDTTNDASNDNGSTDGTNDDSDGNDNGTPVPKTH
jgi:hypothetical protein